MMSPQSTKVASCCCKLSCSEVKTQEAALPYEFDKMLLVLNEKYLDWVLRPQVSCGRGNDHKV